MMRLIFLFTAVCALATSGVALAQQPSSPEETVEYSTDKYKVETNRFWSNWFITVGAGGQIFFGDHDKQASFGDRLAPALDIAVGKWFTPGIGMRLEYSGLSIKGATKWENDPNYDSAHGTGDPVENGAAPHWLQKSKFKMFNLHADMLFNFSNLFCGYNEKRIWNSSAYLGAGWARTWESPTADGLTMNLGWLNSFRLCSALDLNIDVRASLIDDDFDGEIGGHRYDGMLTATAGLTYKFKPRGWERSKTVTRTHFNNDEINAMREKLNRMSEENARLQKALEEGKKAEAQAVVKKIAAANLVTFKIGKSDLSNEARANLQLLAEVIKNADANAVYTVTGYADKGTGSKAINERLSKERAEAVYKCLVEEFGVSKSQLRIDYKGGVDNMFYDDPRLSRAVITQGR
ncbi:OmpA family protein [uncultured Bacteroides sp.]|jgi:major outer membrane protein ompA|uniref:OmpA family protein n=1 Tax=uncultured Bacteroides sp. TaxID=162156 RepID=UPI00280B1F93|nr:OmpA family protein [uncultured Bacteroides sp.]